jgi:hypothetical protein
MRHLPGVGGAMPPAPLPDVFSLTEATSKAGAWAAAMAAVTTHAQDTTTAPHLICIYTYTYTYTFDP